MLKYAVVLAAMAVSSSLAANIPAPKEPVTASTSVVATNKRHTPATVAELGAVELGATGNGAIGNGATGNGAVDGGGGGSSVIGWLLDSGVLSLLDAVASPKKLIGAAISHVVVKLKSLSARKVLHTALVAAVVTVMTAVAAVAVAGLVSVVYGVCAVLPYVRFNFSNRGNGQTSDPQMDAVGEFVLNAFDKYDSSHRKW